MIYRRDKLGLHFRESRYDSKLATMLGRQSTSNLKQIKEKNANIYAQHSMK